MNPLPPNEAERLQALQNSGWLDDGADPKLDEITVLASYLFQTPMALISLVEKDRQWFKARVGMPFTEFPRKDAFCAHTILYPGGMVIPDALEDARFAANPLVREAPHIRFYAGTPLTNAAGLPLGTLCVIDTRPRPGLNVAEREILAALGAEAAARAILRRASRRLATALLEQKRLEMQHLLRCRIAGAIAEASDVAQGLQAALEQICQVTGWTLGSAWTRDEERKSPEGCAAWHAARAGFEALRLRAAQDRFKHGGALRVRVWQEARAVFVPDVAAEGRRYGLEEAAALGFKAAAAFPVLVDGKTAAVLEFLLGEPDGETPRLVAFVEEVVLQIGAALRRKGLDERLRKHEAELSRVNRIKDHFLAMLAHELRNPLAPILNAVELLRTPDPGDAVEVIERQVRHMARLVEDLLDVSRVTRGKITLHKTRLDLVESVRSAVRTARNLLAERAFTEALPPGQLWVDADPVRIEQIVGNLLNNAVKYTAAGQTIALSLRREGKEALLQVRDGGIGIPPEMQERIFEPFVQSEESLAMTRGGLGLGLALVRQLVGMHGGTVGVRSEGAERGSDFFVRLPLAQAPASNAEAASTAIETTVDGAVAEPERARRVLIVEDNADLSGTLRRLLGRWGHQVETAAGGREALAKAAAFRPDVALIDLGLPGMDGYAVAGALAAALGAGVNGLELIAITGYGQEADRARAAQAGFHEFMLKPLDPAALRERLGKRRPGQEGA